MVTINASYITAFAVMLTALEVNFFFKCSEIASSQRASLIAQLVKNPSAMQDTWVRSLGREDALEKGKITHFRPGYLM